MRNFWVRDNVARGLTLAALALLSGCAVAVVGGGAGAGIVASDSRSVGEVVDDHLIEIRARATIDSHDDLRRQTHINIYSENGTVLLVGQAPTPEMRDQVLTLVQNVPYVRRIINQIVVGPASTMGERAEDAWLTTEVKARLVATKGVDSGRIRVITSGQIVYLMGLVPKAEGDLAAKTASQVPDVLKIVELFEFTS